MRTILTFFTAAFLSFTALTACAAQDIDAPQPTLPQSPLIVETANGPVTLTVEIADDPHEVRTGMMFRQQIGDDEGMLFDMERPHEVFFWMHNTLIPLDIIFIAEDGHIHRIAANSPRLSDALIPSSGSTLGVLEIGGGRAQALGIEVGDLVRHPLFGNAPD